MSCLGAKIWREASQQQGRVCKGMSGRARSRGKRAQQRCFRAGWGRSLVHALLLRRWRLLIGLWLPARLWCWRLEVEAAKECTAVGGGSAKLLSRAGWICHDGPPTDSLPKLPLYARHPAGPEQVDALYHFAKWNFECGNYSAGAARGQGQGRLAGAGSSSAWWGQGHLAGAGAGTHGSQGGCGQVLLVQPQEQAVSFPEGHCPPPAARSPLPAPAWPGCPSLCSG